MKDKPYNTIPTVRIISLAISAVLACAFNSSAVLTYTNGTHLIDTNIADSLRVAGDAQVTFAPGAYAFEIEVQGNAIFYMTGGQVGLSLNANGGSSFVSGGEFNLAGVLTSGIFVHDGGSGVYLRMENVAVDILASSTPFYPETTGTATVDIVSGTVNSGLWTGGNGVVNIWGGYFNALGSGLKADGLINIFGGNFYPGSFITGGEWDGGDVNIYGYSFSYPFGTIPDESGTLTGTLRDWGQVELDFLPPYPPEGRQAVTVNLLRSSGITISNGVYVGLTWSTNAGSSVIEYLPRMDYGAPWIRLPGIPVIEDDHYKAIDTSSSNKCFYRLVRP